MPDDSGDKSHDPTPHRRQQARDQGQVVQSQDLTSAGLLVGGLLVLMLGGSGLLNFLASLMTQQLGGAAWLSADSDFLMANWSSTTSGLASTLLPILGVMLLLAVALNFMQVGLLFMPAKVAPDLTRLSPLGGLARIFSLTSTVRLGFGILKIAVVAGVAAISLYDRREEILGLTTLELPQIALYAWQISISTALKIGLALVALAALDYGFQRWKHERDLKMSPQELREEMRNLQGDPQVAARRKTVQRQLRANRVSSAVPKADVVITSATHAAIAIQYDPATMDAPLVVAKGAGEAAERIQQMALEHGIPLVEREELAATLYREVDLNRPIPDRLYADVADTLAHAYQLQGKQMPSAA